MRIIIKPGGLVIIGMAFALVAGVVAKGMTKPSPTATLRSGSAGSVRRVRPDSVAPGDPGERKGEIVSLALLYPADKGKPTAVTAQLINGATQTQEKNGFSLSGDSNEKQCANAGKPLIDTAKSFSVSVWVRFNNISGFQTFVSQDGNFISGFYLQKRADSGRFAFTLNSNDAKVPENPGAALPVVGYRAQSSFPPVAGQWYHLVGVYDAEAHQVRLYIDGSREQTTELPKQVKFWQAQGSTIFGGALWEGKRVDHTNATLEDIRLYPRVLTEEEVTELYKGRQG